MKAFWNHSIALFTMLGLTIPAGTASAGGFTDFVAGQVRQQINTPQQTPITSALKLTKKAASVVVNKGYDAAFDRAVQAGQQGNNGGLTTRILRTGANVVLNNGQQGGVIQAGAIQAIAGNKGINPKVGIPPFINNNNNNGGHPILENIAQQVISNILNNAMNGGNGGGGNGNNNGGGNNGNINNGNFNNGNVQTFAQIDLELHDLKLVDLGDETMGPAYRLTVRNNSQRSATSPFVAVLMASQDAQPTADSPYNTVQVPQLAAGQSTTFDIRLPAVVAAQSEDFGFLTAAVGSPAGTTDQDNANNQVAFQRSSVSEIPAKVLKVGVDETAGHMTLEGEGFGSKVGEVFLTVAGQKYKATVKAWGPAAVYFTIDGFDGANSDTASFTLVRNDGRLAPSLDVAIAN